MKITFTCLLAVLSLVVSGHPYLVAQQQESAPVTTRTVTGTEIGHYKNGPLPVDLSTVTVAVYVPNGSGGYDVMPGSGTSAGTFTISGVPFGVYLLQLGSSFLVTGNTIVNEDSSWDFRSNGVPANSGTKVTFDLTNLDAWQSTDVFEMVCTNNSAFALFDGAVGETTFVGTFPYAPFYTVNLSDASRGDQYEMIQLSTQRVGGLPFTGAARAFVPAKFTQAQGSNTQFNGTLATLAQTQEFEANINGADLTAQALAANPGAQLGGTSLVLDAYPGSPTYGERTSTPDLVGYNLSFYVTGPNITTNEDFGKVAYGNPFPATWPLFDLYSWVATTYYTAPGASNSLPLSTFVEGYNTALPTSTSPIKPLVGVVTNPTINGQNFFSGQTGIGVTPTLRWSPPSVGKATFYQVDIIQLSNSGGNTVETAFTAVRTPSTTLMIPQGLLSVGQGYAFVIRSWYIPGLNFAKTPFMSGPVSAFTDVISGLMQP